MFGRVTSLRMLPRLPVAFGIRGSWKGTGERYADNDGRTRG